MNDRTSALQATLLQKGVSCALATLHAIEALGLPAAPSGDAAHESHEHVTWLLDMLRDHLVAIQQKVDALEAPLYAAKREG